MVAICAFLIILVILFGVEAVRSFVFGTFGVIAWIVIGIFGLAGLIYAGEWFHDALQEDKKRRKEAKGKKPVKKWFVALYGSFIAIFIILIIALIISSQH